MGQDHKKMLRHPALDRIADATRATAWEGKLWLVGGCVRDSLLGLPASQDFDLVLESSAADLASALFHGGLSKTPPVIYARFGTAMLVIEDTKIEFVTARRESYSQESRKPEVEPATLREDAQRRDFTVNALLQNLHSGEIFDPLETGLVDLESKLLRTPLDPASTFFDDPLRMLRAVRFRHRLGFSFAPGLAEAIQASASRLAVISAERIQEELVKMLGHPTAPEALREIQALGLAAQFAPEWDAMVGVEQGRFHHLEVWEHTLLVLKHAGHQDLILSLAAIFHDVGKPATRMVDDAGNTRFFGHETLGATMTAEILRRLRFSEDTTARVAHLVKNHMRLGSSPTFSPSAARRVIRDMGEDLERLLSLVEADTASLRPGVKTLDLDAIRNQIGRVAAQTPRDQLESPLTGLEIIEFLNISPGPKVGEVKAWLTEQVLEGTLSPGDKEHARHLLSRFSG